MKNSGSIISSKFGLILGLLIMLLAALSLLLGWLAFEMKAWVTFYNVLVVWIVVSALIFYHTGKIKNMVSRFFDVLQDQDTVQRFQPHGNEKFLGNLYERMNSVIENLSEIKTQKEKDNLFFRAVIDHAETGLMVYDEPGRIVLMNKAAMVLLGEVQHIKDTPVPAALHPGKRSLLNLEVNGDRLQVAIRIAVIRSEAGKLTLVSLQNIRQELEQHELESWQKLIRVFIHEITNSVSPITLTSTALIGILENETDVGARHSELTEGLKAIRNRSKGISAFMDAYRRLSTVPVPNFKNVPAGSLLDDVASVMSTDLNNRGIRISIHIMPKEIYIHCDEKLIEQVLINLVRNSAEALTATSSPEIRLSCIMLHGRTEIQVMDNGPGIEQEILGQIFVPFFSTKPEGTGIGLSLSRQIMNLHGGSIFVTPKKGNTVFTLSFNTFGQP